MSEIVWLSLQNSDHEGDEMVGVWHKTKQEPDEQPYMPVKPCPECTNWVAKFNCDVCWGKEWVIANG